MQKRFLGDANDHLKGGLHRLLREGGVLHDLHAVPMATDDEWPAAYIETYARLLDLADAGHVCPRSCLRAGARARAEYFGEAVAGVPTTADVLLDPDTGLREAGARTTHVLINELVQLADAGRERVLVVYDESHDRRHEKRSHIDTLGGKLCAGLSATIAYEAGRSLTVFIASRSTTRIDQVWNVLSAFLGPIAGARLHRYR